MSYITQSRNFNFDIIRVVACFMVILMYSPSPRSNLDGVSYHCLDLLSEPCIGLFYMVSGALLLPVKSSFFYFIKKRIGKVLCPTIIFSVITLVFALAYGEITIHFFIKSLCSIPFSTYKAGVLWFMYPLVGMYLIAPIISPFLEKCEKKEVQFLLMLWLITLCWKPLQLILNVDTTEGNMLHVFSGYSGYFLLGYYLNRFPVTKNLIILLPILFIIPWTMDAANKFLGWGVSKYDYFWYLSVFCVMQCVAWFIFIQQCFHEKDLTLKTRNVLLSLSKCSFGIYLTHRIIMQRIVWNIPFIYIFNPYIQILIIFLLTILLSWGTTWIISKCPHAKYAVGFNNNNHAAKY